MTLTPENNRTRHQKRFLILAATSKDAELASEILQSARIMCDVCHDARELESELALGAGGILTVEDRLADEAVLEVLHRHVAQEPDWSDLPILVLTDRGADSSLIQRAVKLLGNLVLLERPVRTASLITTARSSLLARYRQYEVKEAQTRLQENEQRFKSLFDYLPDGAFIRDLEGRFLSTNDAHQAMLGYTLEELQKLSFDDYIAPAHLDRARSHFDNAAQGEPQKFSLCKIRKDGATIEVDMVYLPVVVQGEIVGVHGVARDVTQTKNNERHIKYLATHDVLTGLINRATLDECLAHALESAKRNGTQLGILFLDLNRFKQVNDSLGHEKGDQLLILLAERLREVIRGGDVVARQGGDEFVILLNPLTCSEEMANIAHRIIDTVERPIKLADHEVSVSTSIGGSIFPKDGDDAGTLIRYADLAMYRAKEQGAGAFHFFDDQMTQEVLEQLLTENALRVALPNREFEVYYQPRISTETERIIGMEALVRWHHPQKGLILPAEFVPLAEEIGMITQIGEWVLEVACKQLRAWKNLGFTHLSIAVNISAFQLSSLSLVEKIRNLLAENQLQPGSLELEITETGLMKNMDLSCQLLGELRAMGVRISMDDFGTGYSSLAHIKRLPIDILKIDQSFMANITEDRDDAAIVSATIALARHFGLDVVAEGVNSEDQVRFLNARGCYEMQGHLFGRASPSLATTALLRKAQPQTGVEWRVAQKR